MEQPNDHGSIIRKETEPEPRTARQNCRLTDFCGLFLQTLGHKFNPVIINLIRFCENAVTSARVCSHNNAMSDPHQL